MNAAPDIIDEMMFNEEISRSRFAITPQRLSALKDFSTFLSLLINLVLIAFIERVDHYRDVYEP
jgi:hypothetical protein